MEAYQYIIALVGGVFAGVLNTLAGNGSAITLTILTEIIGLSPNLANGTNRIGIFSQSIAGSYSFIKNGKLPLSRSLRYIIPTVFGAFLGVWIAVHVSNEQFKEVFRYLMIGMLVVILVNPKRWLRETDLETQLPILLIIPIYFALGIYGGFIQMGMGVFFLASMVLLAKFDIVEGNAVKIVVVAIYTIFVILIFQWKGLIDWKVGAVMAIGQTTGGFFAAQWASTYKKANIWVYRLLVVSIIGSIILLFDLHLWLPALLNQ